MAKRFLFPYYLALIGAPAAALLRLFALTGTRDDLGLPAMNGATWALIAGAAVYLILALLCAGRTPCKSGRRQVIRYGRGGFVCALAAAALITLGAVLGFAGNLAEGPGITAPLLVLLGLLGGIGCFVSAWGRQDRNRRLPAAELLPVLYILVQLIISFKGWSTDPIILDYCFRLFGLIFALMAFLRGAGFCLDQGKPARTLFWSLGAVFFCASAMMDGILGLRPALAASYLGCMLWQFPLILSLGRPAREKAEEH